MKILCHATLAPIAISVIFICEIQTAQGRDTRITAEVTLTDSDGRAVPGVVVRLALPRYKMGDKDEYAEVLSNSDGKCTVSGIAQQDYVIIAKKPGYYSTTTQHLSIDTPTGMKRYAMGIQHINLEIREKRNPVNGISRDVDRIALPKRSLTAAYDVEVGDWVAPNGRGKIADFLFHLEGRYSSRDDYDEICRLSFSNPADGILLFKYPKHAGSQLKFPYLAPESGYVPEMIWRLCWGPNGGSAGTTVDGSGETNYIFRVRTEVDPAGKIVRAMYGVVMNDFIPVAGNDEIGRLISFTYAVNPDGTRNIEFDPEKIVTSPH